MAKQSEFVTYLVELLQTIGPVRAQRMFGGHGFFLGDLMFALESDNIFYLKADAETAGEFRERGLAAFTYMKQGKPCSLSYFQAPEEALESSVEMHAWADRAHGAAVRAAARKSRKSRKSAET
jgi:DNA transformation protein